MRWLPLFVVLFAAACKSAEQRSAESLAAMRAVMTDPAAEAVAADVAAEIDPNEPVPPPSPGAPLPHPSAPMNVVASHDNDVAPLISAPVAVPSCASPLEHEVLADGVNVLASRADVAEGKVNGLIERVGEVTVRVERLENAPPNLVPAPPTQRSASVFKETLLQGLVRTWREGSSAMALAFLAKIRRDNKGTTKTGILALLRTECTDPAFMIWAGDHIPADQGQGTPKL